MAREDRFEKERINWLRYLGITEDKGRPYPILWWILSSSRCCCFDCGLFVLCGSGAPKTLRGCRTWRSGWACCGLPGLLAAPEVRLNSSSIRKRDSRSRSRRSSRRCPTSGNRAGRPLGWRASMRSRSRVGLRQLPTRSELAVEAPEPLGKP